MSMAVQRRLSFGNAAALYDRLRPSYPAELVDDVLGFAALAGELGALEVGAGTGKATALLAAKGLSIEAIEPSAEMAALARRNCAKYPRVKILEAEFESWAPPAKLFGLVYGAQAWHWIEPEARYVKARRLMPRGGALAAFWSRPDWESCELAEAVDERYRTIAPQMLDDAGPMHPGEHGTPTLWGDPTGEIEATGGYETPLQREYRWRRSYPTARYIELLQTHSDHIVLPSQTLTALLDAVAEVIDAAGGELQLDYETRLTLARAA
jgi:SAM-dependent methyltransferase